MGKSKVNGHVKADQSPIKEELASAQSTPRRSKRKVDFESAESAPSPSKLAKTEINGNVKASATSKKTDTTTSRSQRRNRETLPDNTDSPAQSGKGKGTLKEKAEKVAKKVKSEFEKLEGEVEAVVDGKKAKKKSKRSTQKNGQPEDSNSEDADGVQDEEGTEPKKKIKRKRKTKQEKEAEMLPLAARTAGVRMLVGAHVSMAGGLENAVKNATKIGGNAFALFLRSPQKWETAALKDQTRDAFVTLSKEHAYDQSKIALPHGSYLVNLAVEDQERADQAYGTFIDDLNRCEELGIKLYNFHPGAHSKSTLQDGIGRIATQLNRALSETKNVIPVLENAAGIGTTVGSRFSDLRGIIDLIAPEHKHRIGVCIDTCHAFAAGYDMRTPESFKAVWNDFDSTVGMQYLKALHLNDSKAPLDSKKDLHQNIGLGFLGLRAFHNIMNDARFEGLPLILETPAEDNAVWAREIKLLENLTGMDPGSTEYETLESELSEKGRAERVKVQEMIDKVKEKKTKALEKGQKSIANMFGGTGGGGGGGGGKKVEGKGGKKTTAKRGRKRSKSSDPLSELSELSDISSGSGV